MWLYNTDHSPAVVGHWTTPAIPPGECGNFDNTTAEQLLNTGRWSATNPRAGLAAERAFKQKRDSQTPAVPDDKGAAE